MYLFFVRAFNDIDHISPIVWKMSRDHLPVAVYCINPEYDIKSDYRLNFLKTLGVKVDFLYNDFDQKAGKLHKTARAVMFWSYKLNRQFGADIRLRPRVISKLLAKYFRTLAKLSYALLKKLCYHQRWAENILEQSRAKALCFDHIRPKQYIVNALLKAAKAKSIPTLALPHGVFIYTNRLVKAGSTSESRFDKFNLFDYVITQNELRKEDLARAGILREKIFVLGSARYCNGWMAQNRKILPRGIHASSGGVDKLKAVFMTTRFVYRIDTDRMVKTFDLLATLKDIEVVVKPHTRTGKEAHFYDNLPLANVADVNSVELCEWADVVMVVGSSILIEALAQDKPTLYLKYLHGNTTQYEEIGACWTIHNEGELKEALLALQTGNHELPYSAENVAKFMSEIIYGGQPQRDVLQGYESFIVNSAIQDA